MSVTDAYDVNIARRVDVVENQMRLVWIGSDRRLQLGSQSGRARKLRDQVERVKQTVDIAVSLRNAEHLDTQTIQGVEVAIRFLADRQASQA